MEYCSKGFTSCQEKISTVIFSVETVKYTAFQSPVCHWIGVITVKIEYIPLNLQIEDSILNLQQAQFAFM